jgi:beta-N-acetylhexosaminidase
VLHTVLAAVAAAVGVPTGPGIPALTPQQKAKLLVVSGQPAEPGIGGVLVQRWNRNQPRPWGALAFADQEGGRTRAFRDLPPRLDAARYTNEADAFSAGRDTARALRRVGVHVDLAPVVDASDGPLGSRLFRTQSLGVAFGRGLAAGGIGWCAKHFPGLGSTPVSTDDRPHVDGTVRPSELAGFRAAVRAGAPCVMTSNAFYDGARFRATISPSTYKLLRSLGFRGVAITDSLSIVRNAPIELWSRKAVRAGADLLLFTSAAHARRAVAALVPLAQRGELDTHVQRVLVFRRRYLR